MFSDTVNECLVFSRIWDSEFVMLSKLFSFGFGFFYLCADFLRFYGRDQAYKAYVLM